MKQAPDSGTGAAGGTGGTASTSTTSGTGGSCCDCDGDGVRAMGLCGGDDCDDQDKDVYPHEPVYHADKSTNSAIGFDWDCSGLPERDPTLDRTVDCGPLKLPCDTQQGYLAKTAPDCGVGGPWGKCKPDSLGLSCVEDKIADDVVMKCK